MFNPRPHDKTVKTNMEISTGTVFVLNVLLNDIKSKIELFADNVKLLVRLLSKEATQM